MDDAIPASNKYAGGKASVIIIIVPIVALFPRREIRRAIPAHRQGAIPVARAGLAAVITIFNTNLYVSISARGGFAGVWAIIGITGVPVIADFTRGDIYQAIPTHRRSAVLLTLGAHAGPVAQFQALPHKAVATLSHDAVVKTSVLVALIGVIARLAGSGIHRTIPTRYE